MKFTPTSIRALVPPPGKRDHTFFDPELPGFGIRCRETGSRVFVVEYKAGNGSRRPTRRMTLGAVTALDLGKARTSAKAILAAVRLGQDPAGDRRMQKQKVAATFSMLLPRYLAHKRASLKPRSYLEVDRHLSVHAKPLHPLSVSKIDRSLIATTVASIGEQSGPTAANRVRTSLSGYFVWLLKEGEIETNPVAYTNKAVENGARKHVISDAELRQIWRVLGVDQYSTIIKLMLLIGARREEVGGLRWPEINFKKALITLPPERTKNKQEHLIPLAPAVVAILKAQPHRLNADGTERDHIFGHGDNCGWQDWSGSKADLDNRIKEPIRPWVPHDFRRTMSTKMHETVKDGGFGIAPHVIEALLAHISGYKAGVAGTYNRAAYFEERRHALQRWARFVLSMAEKPAKRRPRSTEQQVLRLQPN